MANNNLNKLEMCVPVVIGKWIDTASEAPISRSMFCKEETELKNEFEEERESEFRFPFQDIT